MSGLLTSLETAAGWWLGPRAAPSTLEVSISSIMTLEPGDVILTGTPSGVSPLLPGDSVKVAVEGLGDLENSVAVSVAR